jgi:hypothetical protein
MTPSLNPADSACDRTFSKQQQPGHNFLCVFDMSRKNIVSICNRPTESTAAAMRHVGCWANGKGQVPSLNHALRSAEMQFRKIPGRLASPVPPPLSVVCCLPV